MKLKPGNQNPDVSMTFNSDTVELLGFTHEYLQKVSGIKLPENIVTVAHEIALVSAKLNALCSQFDRLLAIQRISEIQQKQVEWAEMIAARRAERAAKERVKAVKSLRGIDRKLYEKTGELPYEYEMRIKDAFKAFQVAMLEKEKF